MPASARRKRLLSLLLLGLMDSVAAPAQNPPSQPAPAADKNAPEMTSRDAAPTFTTRANLVLVRVVVRDREGHDVGTLTKDDFQLFDKGKPQFISKFSMERGQAAAAPAQPADKSAGAPTPSIAPDRFVLYLFDNVHLSFEDLGRARQAAERHLTESLTGNTRAAIFTTSGQPTQDFTADIALLRDTLSRITPRSMSLPSGTDCPDINYYEADLIENKRDPVALQAATADTILCAHLDPTSMQDVARSMAEAAASRVISLGDMETRLVLTTLNSVVRRIAGMPGQRSVVVVSSGFLIQDALRQDELDIMDRALRSNVTISAVDARGLYAQVPGGDASISGINPGTVQYRAQYQRESATMEGDVMAELAAGTGGTFFFNSNDLLAGFTRVAAPPEYLYTLGFSPQNLKFDGSYHNLKVTLKSPGGMTLQARRGYFAPKHELDAAQEAKREVEEALFSRDEWHDIPVDLHTQFFKASDENARLSVLARVDVRQLRFRKADGRNLDTLTVVSGIFDRNGNYIKGVEKTIDMHLKDETLQARLANGITIRAAFDVTPGSYVVRLVVRDTEGQKMGALNGAVEIP